MGLFDKFKMDWQNTPSSALFEIKRVVTRSPKLTGESIEELEAALIAADLGMAMTGKSFPAVKKNYESQGGAGLDFLASRAAGEKVCHSVKWIGESAERPDGVSIVGVNGTGKTTTSAKLAHFLSVAKKPRCRRVRHVSRGGDRAVETVGRALEDRSHRPAVTARTRRRARRRDRRAGALGVVTCSLTRRDDCTRAGGGSCSASRHRQNRCPARRTKCCSCSTTIRPA